MNSERKKLLYIGIGIIAFVVLMVVILLIIHAVSSKKTTYKGIEEKVLTAAKKYYGDNKTLLPQSNGDEVSIDDTSLTAAGYLKPMNELTKSLNATCTAKVIVTKNNDALRYTPLLDCGDKYSSNTLASQILKKENRVYSGDGLYELNGEYVFRGENPNNHIKFSGKNYRIVKITDGKVVIILDEKYERVKWDDRYNVERERTEGINDYSVSRIKETLDSIYENGKFISNSNKSLVASHTLYIGNRSEADNYNDGSIEKSSILENQYIGLLPLYDYINASIDQNCSAAMTNSCSNYNYLSHFDYNWWTITGDSANTYKVYRVYMDGQVEAIRAISSGYIRPVVYLVADGLYVSGNGTEDSPYIVK